MHVIWSQVNVQVLVPTLFVSGILRKFVNVSYVVSSSIKWQQLSLCLDYYKDQNETMPVKVYYTLLKGIQYYLMKHENNSNINNELNPNTSS